jgi:hypothetical protein
MLGCWKLKVTAGIENTRNRLIWHAQPVLSFKQAWTSLLSGSPSSAMRFLTHREDLYDVTDSSCVSIRFESRVFRFYSTDGASGWAVPRPFLYLYFFSTIKKVFTNLFPFLCIGAHAFGFVDYVCSTNFYLLFSPISTHVRTLSQFLFHIFLLYAAELAWSQMIK